MFAKLTAFFKSEVAKVESGVDSVVHEIISPITAIRNKLVATSKQASTDATALQVQARALETRAVQASVVAANLTTLTRMPSVPAVTIAVPSVTASAPQAPVTAPTVPVTAV